MKLGVAIPQRDWPSQDERPFKSAVDYAVRAEQVGFEAVWLSDHYFLEFGSPRLGVGPEPLTALSAIASVTERVTLGTLVLCAPLRPPGALAREASSLAELSDGRFILGLGAGWHQPEFDAFDIPFDHLYSRFAEYLELVIALLDGGPVDFEGEYFKVNQGEIIGGARPRVMVAGAGDKMISLAGRLADAWTMPGSFQRFPTLLPKLHDAVAEAGRPTGSVTTSCGAPALMVSPDEANRLLPEPTDPPVAIGAEGLRELVDRQEQAGADEIILHFSGALWTGYGIDQLDLAAEALGL